MDGSRFDALAKAVGAPGSRRRLLARAAAAALAVMGHGSTEAAPGGSNPCVVACADQSGRSGAVCRQACKQCGGRENICGPFVAGQFVCCPGPRCCFECGDTSCFAFCCPSGTVCGDPSCPGG